jgi:hypothetical protein
MKIEPAFGVEWVSVGGAFAQYSSEPTGGYVRRGDVEELQQKAARLWRTIDLMRRADDIETVRAIATICIGESET